MPVTDCGTLGVLHSFHLVPALVDAKPLNANGIGFDACTVTGVCDNQFAAARKLLILKRRDAGAVDQARLENDSGDAHRMIPKHFFAQSIQRLPATECLLM